MSRTLLLPDEGRFRIIVRTHEQLLVRDETLRLLLERRRAPIALDKFGLRVGSELPPAQHREGAFEFDFCSPTRHLRFSVNLMFRIMPFDQLVPRGIVAERAQVRQLHRQ